MRTVLLHNDKVLVSTNQRFEELDGLRGLASLSVFFSHVYYMQKIDIIPYFASHSPLRSIWDGSAAVLLFFILSGFVLALPYLNAGRPIEFIPYFIRRIFRIYPAYVCALALSLLLMHFVFVKGNLSELSDWICSFWSGDVSVSEITQHLTMIRPDTNKIDPPVWTLRYEMIISSIFPLIIYVLQGFNPRKFSAIIIGAFLCFILAKPSAFFYFSLFITGGILAKFHMIIIRKINEFGAKGAITILALAFLLYSSRFTVGAIGNNETLWHIFVSAGAALLIIAAISCKPFTLLLRTKPIQFLGHISYGLYLLHFPILLATSSLVFPITKSLVLCGVISLIASMTISHLMAKLVENPFQKIGRKISRLEIIVLLQKKMRLGSATLSTSRD